MPSNLRRARTLCAAGVLAALISGGFALRAADHADSPDTSESNLDVNDLYVFNRGDDVVFVMTVAPLLTPGQATADAALNPDGLYQFKLDVERDGIEDAVIQVAVTGTGPTQQIHVRGPAAPETTGAEQNIIVGGPRLDGSFDSVIEGNGMRAFAGPRDDPFFVHLFGDESLTSVLNAAYGGALGQPVGDSSEQSLSFSDPGPDDLAGLNVLAIVIEMPRSMLANALGIGTTDVFYAWATTSHRQ